MKQKILGFLLMGAFAIASTSTFVSCKDYDDDISGLQTKINDLTTLVNSKESTIKTSVSSLDTGDLCHRQAGDWRCRHTGCCQAGYR